MALPSILLVSLKQKYQTASTRLCVHSFQWLVLPSLRLFKTFCLGEIHHRPPAHVSFPGWVQQLVELTLPHQSQPTLWVSGNKNLTSLELKPRPYLHLHLSTPECQNPHLFPPNLCTKNPIIPILPSTSNPALSPVQILRWLSFIFYSRNPLAEPSVRWSFNLSSCLLSLLILISAVVYVWYN